MKNHTWMRAAARAGTLCAAFLLFAPDVAAQYFGRNKVNYEDFDFQKIETDHYEIFFYPVEERATRDAARMAERWYDRHESTFQHSYDSKPLFFYANDADFHQTNIIEGQLGEGTGGVTEGLLNRVVMPHTGIYAETDHVLGHELVHTFQYDIAGSPGGPGLSGLGRTPLWLIEGMAEYLTIGRNDPHTAMWMRDAVLRNELPTIEDLSGGRFFPYRYGQALMAYVAGRYGGDRAVTNLFREAIVIGLDSAIISITGKNPDSLSAEWHRTLRDYYTPLLAGRTSPDSAGRRVLARDIDAGNLNIAPVVSPDGRYVAFISERELFSIEIFIADTRTGEVIERLTTDQGNGHIDALRFINSAGAWSPDGRRFAYVTFARGDNRIEIVDVASRESVRRIALEDSDVGAIYNLTWAPNGQYIAFSGTHGGISDLFLFDTETGNVRQLTDDRYADIMPEWSPDGVTLAFVTDRGPGGTDLETLTYGAMRLGFINTETGDIRTANPFPGAKHINPQYSPDGRSVYFISDREGFSDVYRLDVQSGAAFQITRLQTGVSGITGLSPAMSVADETGLMMFSVYQDNDYTVFAVEPDQTTGTPVQPAPLALAGLLPPAVDPLDGEGGPSTILALGPAPEGVGEGAATPYRSRLRLAYIGTPTLGVGYDQQFGAGISGGISFLFTDLLGNHIVSATVQAQGQIKDVGAQVQYINRSDQLNWGASVSHIPYLTGGYPTTTPQSDGTFLYEQTIRRYYFTGGEVLAQYPFTTTRRVEANARYTHIGSDFDQRAYVLDPSGRVLGRVDPMREDPAAGINYNLFQGTSALVGDNSFFGFTSPVRGGRYRLEAGYTAGTFNYGTLIADYRRYFYAKPVTFAVNAYHSGRYGGDTEFQTGFYPLNLGYSTYNIRGVHGYGINSIEPGECEGESVDDCALLQRIIGNQVAVAAAEIRIPFLGTREFGLINFPYLPTELVGFFDAGIAWDWQNDRSPGFSLASDSGGQTTPVFSTGAAARVNLLGYIILEGFYAYPFQRPEKGGYFGLTLQPGW